VRVQNQPDQPRKNQYILAGRWDGKSFQYAWLRPGMTEADQAETNLPVRTDWISAADPDCTANLREKALTLNRIYGWMTLDVPGGGFSGSFPYRLALRKAGAPGYLVPGRDVTKENEQYKVWLTANPDEVASLAKTGRIAQRWVYVIVIDRDGNVSVVIPGSESNVGNRLPAGDAPAAEIQLTSDPYDFSIGPPFGLDTYILLTSQDELDPRIFAAKGVRTRADTRGAGNPLADLLHNIGASSLGRGVEKPVPANWSVERITFRSEAAK
jgi:hypothetical protein